MGEGIIQPRFYAGTFGGKEYAMDIEEKEGLACETSKPVSTSSRFVSHFNACSNTQIDVNHKFIIIAATPLPLGMGECQKYK